MNKSNILIAFILVALAMLPGLFDFGKNYEYEYASLVGWLLLLFVPLLALILPSATFSFEAKVPQGLPTPPSKTSIFGAIGLFLLIFLIYPASVFVPGGVAFYFDACKCSVNGYFFWMALQSIPCLMLSIALLRLYFEIRHSMNKKWILAFIHLSLLVSCLIGLVVIMWFFPQKRMASFLFGFLHGPIYDTWIPVDSGVILNRLSAWIFSVILFFGARLIVRGLHEPKSKWKCLRIIGGSLLIPLFVWGMSLTSPSGGHGKDVLKDFLNADIRGKFANIHYRPDERIDIKLYQNLHLEAEFHAAEIMKKLNEKSGKPIDIYVYPSGDQKKIYFGGGGTDVTDVWTPSIHIALESLPHSTLRHELVHAISSRFGWHGLGFHPNMMLTEGLAVALAPEESRGNLHKLAAQIVRKMDLKHLKSLLSPISFWSESGAKSYTIAGSFLQFVMMTSPPNAVKKIYSGQSFETTTGKSIGAWIDLWQVFLKKNYPNEENLQVERVLRAPGVFKEVCPHTRSDYAQDRELGWTVRLRQPMGWDPTQYRQWQVRLEDNSRSSLFSYWKEQILKQSKERALTPLALETWLELISKNRSSPIQVIEDVELGILESDLLVLAMRRDESVRILNELQSDRKFKIIGEQLQRQVLARLEIDNRLPVGDLWTEWRRYLGGFRSIPGVAPENQFWIFNYLKLRSDKNILVENLNGYLMFPIDDVPVLFKREWVRLLFERYLNINHFERAYQMANQLETLGGDNSEYYAMYSRLAKAHAGR
ncbi:MAG: hypothetical protein NT027_08165 [Proteobacteria bacterium]|nr:hypothetical protein [Pseudomonadota bacterium]